MQVRSLENVLEPLMGLHMWSIRRGHGTFIMLDFGEPWLSIREPIKPKANEDKVIKMLKRRRVSVVGRYQLWIYEAIWNVFAGNLNVSNEDDSEAVTTVFNMLNGQKLSGFSIDAPIRSCVFHFDLGGELRTSPSRLEREDQWRLFERDKIVASYQNDGHLVVG